MSSRFEINDQILHRFVFLVGKNSSREEGTRTLSREANLLMLHFSISMSTTNAEGVGLPIPTFL